MKTLEELIREYATEVRNGNNEKALSIAKEIRNFDETESEEINMNNNTNTSEKPFVFIPAKEIKEEITMNENNNTATNNSATEKEMVTMTRVERIMNMYDTVKHATKTTDDKYIRKDILAKFLFDNDIIQHELSKNEIKRTKRDELVDILNNTVQNLINSGVIKPIEIVDYKEMIDMKQTKENVQGTEVVAAGDFVYDKMPIDDMNDMAEYYDKLADYENNKKAYYNRKSRTQINNEAWQRLANATGLTFDNGNGTKTEPHVSEMTEEDKFNTVVKRMAKASFIANRGDNEGLRIVTMKALYSIIRKVYANNNEQLEESFIKDIINKLVSTHYLSFKKYESGAIIFYPTVKCREYIK